LCSVFHHADNRFYVLGVVVYRFAQPEQSVLHILGQFFHLGDTLVGFRLDVFLYFTSNISAVVKIGVVGIAKLANGINDALLFATERFSYFARLAEDGITNAQ